MAYEELYPKRVRLLYFDVETAPMLGWFWQGAADWIPDKQVASDDRFLLCWSAKWSDSTSVISARLTKQEAVGQDDSRIVAKLADLVRSAPYVVAHNGDRFDLKRLNARVLLNGLQPLGKVQSIDTLQIAKSSFDLPYNNLDYLARKLGFGTKLPTTFELWKRAYLGDAAALKEMSEYCDQDVRLLEAVFHALAPHARRLPRLIDAMEWRQELCPYCGSQDRKKTGVYRTSVNNYPKWRCDGCQREYRGWRAIGDKAIGGVGL